MALEKKEIIDLIEILENGCIQVRNKTIILEDGKEINSSYHRHVVVPGDDYSNENSKVKNICAIIQTPEVIFYYQEKQKENQKQLEDTLA